MSDKILTLHPDPAKTGVNIDQDKYEAIRTALMAVLEREGTMKPMELLRRVGEEVGSSFDGSATWYGETVKLDLEARGIIEHDRKKGILWLKK